MKQCKTPRKIGIRLMSYVLCTCMLLGLLPLAALAANDQITNAPCNSSITISSPGGSAATYSDKNMGNGAVNYTMPAGQSQFNISVFDKASEKEGNDGFLGNITRKEGATVTVDGAHYWEGRIGSNTYNGAVTVNPGETKTIRFTSGAYQTAARVGQIQVIKNYQKWELIIRVTNPTKLITGVTATPEHVSLSGKDPEDTSLGSAAVAMVPGPVDAAVVSWSWTRPDESSPLTLGGINKKGTMITARDDFNDVETIKFSLTGYGDGGGLKTVTNTVKVYPKVRKLENVTVSGGKKVEDDKYILYGNDSTLNTAAIMVTPLPVMAFDRSVKVDITGDSKVIEVVKKETGPTYASSHITVRALTPEEGGVNGTATLTISSVEGDSRAVEVFTFERRTKLTGLSVKMKNGAEEVLDTSSGFITLDVSPDKDPNKDNWTGTITAMYSSSQVQSEGKDFSKIDGFGKDKEPSTISHTWKLTPDRLLTTTDNLAGETIDYTVDSTGYAKVDLTPMAEEGHEEDIATKPYSFIVRVTDGNPDAVKQSDFMITLYGGAEVTGTYSNGKKLSKNTINDGGNLTFTPANLEGVEATYYGDTTTVRLISAKDYLLQKEEHTKEWEILDKKEDGTYEVIRPWIDSCGDFFVEVYRAIAPIEQGLDIGYQLIPNEPDNNPMRLPNGYQMIYIPASGDTINPETMSYAVQTKDGKLDFFWTERYDPDTGGGFVAIIPKFETEAENKLLLNTIYIQEETASKEVLYKGNLDQSEENPVKPDASDQAVMRTILEGPIGSVGIYPWYSWLAADLVEEDFYVDIQDWNKLDELIGDSEEEQPLMRSMMLSNDSVSEKAQFKMEVINSSGDGKNWNQGDEVTVQLSITANGKFRLSSFWIYFDTAVFESPEKGNLKPTDEHTARVVNKLAIFDSKKATEEFEMTSDKPRIVGTIKLHIKSGIPSTTAPLQISDYALIPVGSNVSVPVDKVAPTLTIHNLTMTAELGEGVASAGNPDKTPTKYYVKYGKPGLYTDPGYQEKATPPTVYAETGYRLYGAKESDEKKLWQNKDGTEMHTSADLSTATWTESVVFTASAIKTHIVTFQTSTGGFDRGNGTTTQSQSAIYDQGTKFNEVMCPRTVVTEPDTEFSYYEYNGERWNWPGWKVNRDMVITAVFTSNKPKAVFYDSDGTKMDELEAAFGDMLDETEIKALESNAHGQDFKGWYYVNDPADPWVEPEGTDTTLLSAKDISNAMIMGATSYKIKRGTTATVTITVTGGTLDESEGGNEGWETPPVVTPEAAGGEVTATGTVYTQTQVTFTLLAAEGYGGAPGVVVQVGDKEPVSITPTRTSEEDATPETYQCTLSSLLTYTNAKVTAQYAIDGLNDKSVRIDSFGYANPGKQLVMIDPAEANDGTIQPGNDDSGVVYELDGVPLFWTEKYGKEGAWVGFYDFSKYNDSDVKFHITKSTGEVSTIEKATGENWTVDIDGTDTMTMEDVSTVQDLINGKGITSLTGGVDEAYLKADVNNDRRVTTADAWWIWNRVKKMADDES